MARLAGALLPIHKSYQQEEGCGVSLGPLEGGKRISQVLWRQGQEKE